ncbi:hypothetical protein Ga0074115_10771 [endosymbiont of Ridgeia piscesae]|uniref:Uncharacterized protein n=2 Tax=endosymbiont of Ridgeia piscesae TaxID=54398 RepID=A0A0T5YWD1_9GAMM|nr:hypothetical protein Ga0074115_10771 [endosymbiont of Ridgeia piscesae]KRT58719.1 hypothetical protein Ga0076813_14112 [endosymbiont of Ridgeia piscesae]
MKRRLRNLSPDAPLLYPDHPRPISRRDFIRQGLAAGLGAVTAPGLFGLFANPRQASAVLSSDLQALKQSCGIAVQGAGKIPFICFDLAGGANIAGSNVLVGRQGGQRDFLTTAGYSRLGLPGDMIPPLSNPDTGFSDFINSDLGLAFHSDSAFLRGILERVSPGTAASINGAVIPALNPSIDPDIVGPIFSQAEYDDEAEFRKTAAVMKLVLNGYAGAGTITMGGFDYHTGNRAVGEIRDLRAGRCMGACLEYAARLGVPLMLYCFSDGSVASNGSLDNSAEGRGKGVWTGDNSSTAASFFLVYNPAGRPALLGASPEQQAQHQQIGFFRGDGSVETASAPAANNVNLLVETVVLNYMALHGEQGRFGGLFPGHGLGNAALLDRLTAFQPIVSGTL